MDKIIGKRIHSLVAIQRLKDSKIKCLCDCGNERILSVGHFNTGAIKSCGCHVKRHGHAKLKSREYISWSNMISRCHNKNNKRYLDYGGSGIIVCEEWRKSFKSFYNDIGNCPEGFQIDRINNNLGYFKENCRWVSAKENMANRSITKKYIIDGIKYESSADAAKKLGISNQTVVAWCTGRTVKNISKKTGEIKITYYPPKKNCSAINLY